MMVLLLHSRDFYHSIYYPKQLGLYCVQTGGISNFRFPPEGLFSMTILDYFSKPRFLSKYFLRQSLCVNTALREAVHSQRNRSEGREGRQ